MNYSIVKTQSLKQQCMMAIRTNEMMKKLAPILKDIPQSVLLELCLYLSPYGLQLVEDNTTIADKRKRVFEFYKNKSVCPVDLRNHILKTVIMQSKPFGSLLKKQQNRLIDARQLSCAQFTFHDMVSNNLILTGNRLQEYWLRITVVPSSYILKCRRRKQIQLMSMYHEDDTITEQQFYYNSLLYSIMDNLHQRSFHSTFGNNHVEAWEYYLLYPSTFNGHAKSAPVAPLNRCLKRKRGSSIPIPDRPDIGNFLGCLSRYVTELPLNYPSSAVLLRHFEIFTPVLKNIRKVSLNLIKKPSQDSKKIAELLQQIFKCNRKLTCARIHFHNMSRAGDELVLIWKALYNPTETFVDKKKNEIVLSKENTNTFAEQDLYDFALEPLSNGFHDNIDITVNSKISSLVLSISNDVEKCFCALMPALFLWKNLRSLSLNLESYGGDIYEADFSSMIEGLVSNEQLCHLSLSNLCCEKYENSIIQIAAPKTSCYHLESLRLSMCTYQITMLEQIIVEKRPCDHSENSTSDSPSYFLHGLTSLDIDWYTLGEEGVNEFLKKNYHLKELKMKLQYFDDSAFCGLICAVKDHPSITSCDISSTFSRASIQQEHIIQSLSELLMHPMITQLNLSSCFSLDSSSLMPPLCFNMDFTNCRLVSLIWNNNQLGNEALICIGKKLSDRKQFQYLRNLDLSSNLFDVSGVVAFFESLQKAHRKFRKLSLLGTKFSETDIKENNVLWNSLYQHCCHFVMSFRMNSGDMADHVSVM